MNTTHDILIKPPYWPSYNYMSTDLVLLAFVNAYDFLHICFHAAKDNYTNTIKSPRLFNQTYKLHVNLSYLFSQLKVLVSVK